MINTSDHLHLACIGFAEYALVCSWASALGPLVLSTRSALGMRSLIKRWLRPEVHARSRARRRSSERRRAWSDFPGGSAQWWRQTRQPLLRKSIGAARAEGWAFCRRSKQKSTTHSVSRFGKCLRSILVCCRREDRAFQAEARREIQWQEGRRL